jgi:YVTN family beta-propeller protein
MRRALVLLSVVSGLLPLFGSSRASATVACDTSVYATDNGAATVSVISETTKQVTETISLPSSAGPRGLAVSPDKTTVYVANTGNNTISVIDTATNTITATIPVGSGPNYVAFSADGTKAYVTNFIGNTVSVIDTANRTVSATITFAAGTAPYHFAPVPSSTTAYVTNYGTDTISVIDTTTNTVSSTINLAANSNPVSMIVAPDGSRAYVTYTGANSLSLIDTAINSGTYNTIIGTISLGASQTYGAMSSDGGTLYVSTGSAPGAVKVINTATNAVSTSVAVGNTPRGVAFSSGGTSLWVANSASSLSVIDTATNTAGPSVDMGAQAQPWAIAMGPCVAIPTVAATVSGAGRTLSVTGTGFPAGGAVTLTLGSTSVGTATADSGGAFTSQLTDIECAVLGGTLTATSGRKTASTTVTLDPCPAPSTPTPDSTSSGSTASSTPATTPATTAPADTTPTTAAPVAAASRPKQTTGTIPETGVENGASMTLGLVLLVLGAGTIGLLTRRRRLHS